MKRILALYLVSVFFITALVGCGQAPQEKNEYEELHKENITLSEENRQEISRLTEIYNSNWANITESDLDFLLYWDDYTCYNTHDADNPSCYRFSVLDMNSDGLSEIIVEYNGEHCIIYYSAEKNRLAAVHFGFRGMYNINMDGTFSWNDTSNLGHKYGLSRLDKNMNVINLVTIINDGTDFAEYFIGDDSVTRDELAQYTSQFSYNRIEFYDVTSENLSKYITFESMYNVNSK